MSDFGSNPLNGVFQNWCGYVPLRTGMAAAGFGLHDRYRDHIKENYDGNEESLEEYWEALANHYVRTDLLNDLEPQLSSRLSRGGEGAAVQELKINRQQADAPREPDSLRMFSETFNRDQFSSVKIANLMERSKEREIEAMGIQVPLPLKSRRDQWLLFSQCAQANGFEVDATTARYATEKIELEMTMDVGGRYFQIIQIASSIFSPAAKTQKIYPVWAKLLPGFYCYNSYNTAASCALGLMANLTIAKIFADNA